MPSPPLQRPSALTLPLSGRLPCGSFPFGVLPAPGSHIHPKNTNFWVTLPSQRFDALKALLHLAPSGHISCRIHPWGFPLGTFFTRRSRQPYGCLALMWFTSLVGSAPLTCRTVPLGVTYHAPVNLYRTAVSASSTPRLCPLRIPVIIAPLVRLGNDPRPSLGLFLIRVCSPFAGDGPSNQSLMCFIPGAHAKPSIALQSVASEWHGRSLSSSPSLPRSLTF